MDQDQPNLCPILEAFEEYFNGSMSCKHWPGNFFKHHDKRNETLEHEMYQYAKGQLISKCLLGTFNFPKKFDLTIMVKFGCSGKAQKIWPILIPLII